jgi:hypothetical protein
MPIHFSPRARTAGHPFRQTLGRQGHPLRRTLGRKTGHPWRLRVRDLRKRSAQASEDQDLKLFVLSFTAFFICFASFIL